MWKVFWDEQALNDLKSIDKIVAKKIVSKVSSFLSQDPINLGKPLSAKLSGLMRYRFGDYRVIYEIDKMDIKITVVRIGHRKDIYASSRN